jgi:transcriptional regulator with XRE-family HTH domain
MFLKFNHGSFGSEFKTFRLKNDMTLREVYEQTGVNINTVSKIENGCYRFSGHFVVLAYFADIDLRKFVVEEDAQQLKLRL